MGLLFSKKKGPWGDWENEDDKMDKDNDIFDFLRNFLGHNFFKFGKKEENNKQCKNPNSLKIIVFLFFVLLSVWLFSGFYIVGPEQEALRMVFGKYKDSKISGLHYHYPYPLGSIKKVNVTSVFTMEIGSSSKELGQRKKSDDFIESIMLTKDENMVEVGFDIQWKVGNAADYEFNFRKNDSVATMKSICESSMRKIIGNYNMFSVLEGIGRSVIAADLMSKIQEYSDFYGLGIDVVSVQIKKIDPPFSVIDSFRDVQSAKADKERFINEGYSYLNSVVPEARGRASKIKNDALGYASEVFNSAVGETQRFSNVYDEYKMSKKIIKRKLYFDVINSVVPNWDKVIIDEKSSTIKHFALDEISGFSNQKKEN